MKKLMVLSTMLALFFSVSATPSLAYAFDPFGDVCTSKTINSPTCRTRSNSNPLLGPSGVITRVIQLIVMVAGVATVIMLIFGGIRYIISVGDPSNVNSAKNTILYALIGLGVTVISQAIVSFVLRRL